MGGAVSSAVARALGARRRDLADALALHALVLALGLAMIFSSFMLIGGPIIFRWMGGQGAMLDAALAYSNVIFCGALSVCALNILGNVVRGTGNMTLPSLVIVGSVLGHVLVSPILIFGWGPLPALGPAGAGWGLVTTFGAGSPVLIVYLRSSRSLVTLTLRGVPLQRALFADILKVGVPGMINVSITNLSVVALTGIAGYLGTAAAVGYGMGARLEYILIPLAFGFGTTIVAMVGPAYALYGLGMALYFATQGLGRVVFTVSANAVRLLVSVCGGFAAVFWFDGGISGFFACIAAGFSVYGLVTIWALFMVKDPGSIGPEQGTALPTVTRWLNAVKFAR